MVSDKIRKTYYEYLKNIKNKNHQVVILVPPKVMSEIREEVTINASNLTTKVFNIQLFGNQVPIIIKNGIPKNVTCIVMAKEKYDELEKSIIKEDYWG